MTEKFDWYSPRDHFTTYASESTQQKLATEYKEAQTVHSEKNGNITHGSINHHEATNPSSEYHPNNYSGYDYSNHSGQYYNYESNNQLNYLQSMSAKYEALPVNSRRLLTVSILCASVMIGMNFANVGFIGNQRSLDKYRQAEFMRHNSMMRTTLGKESKLENQKSVKRQNLKGQGRMKTMGLTNNYPANISGNKMNMQNNWPQLQMNLANNGMNMKQPNGVVIVNTLSNMQQHPQQLQQQPQNLGQGITSGQQIQQNPVGQQGQLLMPNQPIGLQQNLGSQPLINQQILPQQEMVSATVTTQQSVAEQPVIEQQNMAQQPISKQQDILSGPEDQNKNTIGQQNFANLSNEESIRNEEPITNQLENQSGGGYVTESGQLFQDVAKPNGDTAAAAKGQPITDEESKVDPMAGFMDGFEGFNMAPISDIPSETDSSVVTISEENGDEDEEGQEDADYETVESVGIVGKPKINNDGTIPLEELKHFKDNWDPWERSDVPVFLHIPKAGGSTIKDLMGTCHRFVMASEMGITDGHDDDPEVAVVYPGGGPVGQDRSPFVNVDTTTVDGILRAKQMGFADSGLADAVVTPFIYEVNDLFTPTAKGRLFTVFRHPIERAISMFYYIQDAHWEPTYDPELKGWTIAQYAQSSKIENNWLTRQLSNQYEGELTEENLKIAMEVIRRKFMVGLMTKIEETMERFERFFHWTYHVNPPNQEKCRQGLVEGGSNRNSSGKKKEKPKDGSEDWNLLVIQNQYDLQLYQYIEVLFSEQEQFVADIPVGFRLVDATCCKCGPPTFPPEGFTCPLAIMN